MSAKVLIFVALVSMTLFSASAADAPTLTFADYNMTKENYISFTKDPNFDGQYMNFWLSMTKITFAITGRQGKAASGTLVFTLEALQQVKNGLGSQTSMEEDVKVTVEISNNAVQSTDLPSTLNVDVPAAQQFISAYVTSVLPTLLSSQVYLPNQYINLDLLRQWAPGSSFQPIYTPDLVLEVHDFSSSLKASTGVSGTITFKLDAYSEFLGYTQRQHGESKSIQNVVVTIKITDDVNKPEITINPLTIKPLALSDVTEMIKGYYKQFAIPAIQKLFA